MITIYYPNKQEAEIEIDVTGFSDDFYIREIRFLMGDNDNDIVITGSLECNERIQDHIRNELVVIEYERKEKEGHYWDLAKDMMLFQREG